MKEFLKQFCIISKQEGMKSKLECIVNYYTELRILAASSQDVRDVNPIINVYGYALTQSSESLCTKQAD